MPNKSQSHEIAQAFESRGQSVIEEIGKIAPDPLRNSMASRFIEVGQVKERLQEAFPSQRHDEIRKRALSIAEVLGKSLRVDEVDDEDVVTSMIQLSLNLAPHITLQDELRAAARRESAISTLGKTLESARVAELSSFGRIAEGRLGVINRLRELIDQKEVDEVDFQELLQRAPWLISPEWSPVTQIQALRTISAEFHRRVEKFKPESDPLTNAASRKRPDLVLFSQNSCVQIVGIKNHGHTLCNDELDWIVRYRNIMRELIQETSEPNGTSPFNDLHITIVCDGIRLTGAQEIAFDSLQDKGVLTHITWADILMRSGRVYEQFLEEAARNCELTGDYSND